MMGIFLLLSNTKAIFVSKTGSLETGDGVSPHPSLRMNLARSFGRCNTKVARDQHGRVSLGRWSGAGGSPSTERLVLISLIQQSPPIPAPGLGVFETVLVPGRLLGARIYAGVDGGVLEQHSRNAPPPNPTHTHTHQTLL